MFELERKASQQTLTQQDFHEAEKINRMKMQALEHADRHCRKLQMGHVEFLLAFQQAAAKVSAYCLLVKKKKKQRISSRLIQRTLKRATISERLRDILAKPVDQLLQLRNQAFANYKEVTKQDDTLRDMWIEDLCKARAKNQESKRDMKTRTAMELKRMRKEEHVRQSARRIKQALGTNLRQGTTMVQETNAHGEVVEHTTKEAIEQCCKTENQRRFSQTFNTPPLVEPLQRELGLLAETLQGDKVLEGTYRPPPTTDPYSKLLFTELKEVVRAPHSAGITTKDFQTGWKKMHERTSAGASLLHFGHMKAIAQHTGNSSFEASQISFAMKSGYSFTRWQTGIDVEILKKAGVWDVKKLRTIVLFEADFNFVNKFLGRKAMTNAELHKALAQEQYGLRKGHRASDHALNKWWTFDLIRQLKRPAAISSNDLKSCYDRIVHSIAALCLRRVGISKSETLTMFTTLQRLRHVICTAYGDSATSYGSAPGGIPFQGIFQGNGGGPTMWANISSPVIEAIRRLGFGAQFRTAFEDLLLEFLGYAFVDDTDLLELKGKSWQSTANDMQHLVRGWEGTLRATGGALATEKCAWWLLDFTWSQDGQVQYSTQETTPAILEARYADGMTKTIPRKEANETFESLGIHQRPDGATDDEFTHLMEAAKKWGNNIRTARLTKEDTLYSLRAFAMPKIMYGCNVAPLDESQCHKITSSLLMTALPKAGFNRFFPRAIIHAPIGELGYRIPHLFSHSVASHMHTILRHGPTTTLSGQLLNATLSCAKAELGINGSLFGLPYSKWSHLLTDCWLKRVWKNVANLPITLTEGSPNPQVIHDDQRTIMEVLVAHNLAPVELRRINKCRIFLHAVYWAELVNFAGTWTLLGVLTRHASFHRYGPQGCFNWPRQPAPTEEDWRVWRLRIRQVFQVTQAGRLLQPLRGDWKVTKANKLTAWYRADINMCVYRTDDRTWRGLTITTCTLNGAKQIQPHPEPLEVAPQLTNGWNPCIIHTSRFRDSSVWVMRELEPRDQHLLPPPINISLQDIRVAINNLPQSTRWACDQATLRGSLSRLIGTIKTGDAILSTDGSYKGPRGTGSFILATPDGADVLFGSNRSPGGPQLQCSLRSELAGICGGLLLLQVIANLLDQPVIHIKLSCDNIEARHQADQTSEATPHPSQEHFDMRRAVMYFRDRQSKLVKVTYEHVRGHQDLDQPWKDLPVDARLNCQADLIAKERWELEHDQPDNVAPLYPNEWRVSVLGEPVGSNVKKTLVHRLTTFNLRQWREE